MERTILVGILDDHIAVAYGYEKLLESVPNIEVAWKATFFEGMVEKMKTNPVDVLILDAEVPKSKQDPRNYPMLHAIPSLLDTYTELAILVISGYNYPDMINNIKAVGANGFISKSDSRTSIRLPEIIRSIYTGSTCFPPVKEALQDDQQTFSLTPRQLEVLALKESDPEMTTGAIAKKLGIAPATVRNLLHGAYERLKVNNITAALDKARRLNLLTPGVPNDLDEDN